MPLQIDTGGKKMAMVFDFDGTISEEDIFDSLFYEYADPQWLEAHWEYHEKIISMKEAYLQMANFFRGSREDIYSFVRRKARLRKGFRELLGKLKRHRIRTLIVSNGFDIYLLYLLDLWRIDLGNIETRCHHAVISNNRFIPHFREHKNLKHDQCLIGKAEVVEELHQAGYFVGFAGNGFSDTPASHVADLVFARGELAEYCQQNRIRFIPYDDFYDVIEYLFGKRK